MRRDRVNRTAVAGATALALGVGLSGCIGIKGTPRAKQTGAHQVQVSFKGCAAGTDGCSDQGPSSTGEMRWLAAVRVPRGTDGPASIQPAGTDVKLKPDASYADELKAKAPTPSGTVWLAYSSKVIDYQGDPLSAKIVVKLGLPGDVGGTFRYRPVLGGASADDAPVDCGTDPYTGAGGNATCIDAPDTEGETEKSLKLKLD